MAVKTSENADWIGGLEGMGRPEIDYGSLHSISIGSLILWDMSPFTNSNTP